MAEYKSLPEAVRFKYLDEDEDDFDNIVIPQNRLQKFSKLHTSLGQQFLTLDFLNISHAGKEGEIGDLCPGVLELELSGNHFKEWKEVFLVISQLPNLRFLNLSFNPLEREFKKDAIDSIVGDATFPRLKTMILNNTFIPMETVFEILKIIPCEELHISINSYDEFPPADQEFPSVKSLLIAGNDIQRCSCVRNLGNAFPSLTSLIFCENPIEELPLEEMENMFANLHTLSLSNTKIKHWDHVDTLRSCPNLSDLRIDGIPLLNDYSADEARRLLIPRLPGVERLNRSAVGSEERVEAERKFIRDYHDQDDKPSRYDELVAIHGHLKKLVDIDLGQNVKATATVTLECDGRRPVLQKINLKQPTSSFKKQMAKKFDLRLSDVRLYYCDAGMMGAFGPEEMKYPTRSLLQYNMNDGDSIQIVEKPPINPYRSRFKSKALK